jgi:hypothetical protein
MSRSIATIWALMIPCWLFASREVPGITAIVTSSSARLAYLASARIWQDPGVLSPQDILKGPPTQDAFARSSVLECSFDKPGDSFGGKSKKFLCRLDDGKTLLVKYWDPKTADGNREVFSSVAATRLMWALGFNTSPSWPIDLRCRDCPADPMSGHGDRSAREYLASVTGGPVSDGALILSSEKDTQGWAWREFERATDSLPPGPERTRQRTHFSALTLLAVFIQHGDRKPQQQRLYCAGSPDVAAGEIRSEADESRLFERPNAASCHEPAAVISDVGATMGGAGMTSNETSAKMNIAQWGHRRMFDKHNAGEPCRGRLTVSMTAGEDGEGNPIIAEEGRAFLLKQFQRLTPDHMRALFTAARANKLRDRSTQSLSDDEIIQQWVDAFQDKVQQIASTQCQPLSSPRETH